MMRAERSLRASSPLEQSVRHASLFGLHIGPHRRHPEAIAGDQTILGLHAFAVHTYLAAAQDSIHAAAGHGLELAKQEVVDPLALGVRGDFKLPDPGTRLWRGGFVGPAQALNLT